MGSLSVLTGSYGTSGWADTLSDVTDRHCQPNGKSRPEAAFVL